MWMAKVFHLMQKMARTGWSILSIGAFCVIASFIWHLLNHYRFVDRDMVMRYYFGLSVGHKYSWSTPNPAEDADEGAMGRDDGDNDGNDDGDDDGNDDGDDDGDNGDGDGDGSDGDDDGDDGDDGDWPAGEQTDEHESDSEHKDSDEEDRQDIDDESDDEEFLARCEMDRIVQ